MDLQLLTSALEPWHFLRAATQTAHPGAAAEIGV